MTHCVVMAVAPLLLPAAPAVAFDRDIRPVLVKHCVACHGPDKQKGGLRLDRRADALAGGDGGPVVVPGKPADSPVIQRVTAADAADRMPPTGPPLAAAEVRAVRDWVAAGAAWPSDGSAAANPADWWSFKPIVPPPQPAAGHPIDAFVCATLAERSLSPSPAADRRTLARRLYFDLIGLPPTPAEIDAFVADPDPQAYAKLADKLLASPRHGERWARHWLDVVHYGETHGYDKDKPRPHAWPYRDYVIRALNSDKPAGRFVAEQLAGDVLYPNTADGVEALGFLAAGPWDFIGHAELPESKADGKVARHLDRDDFVANTAGTFLGLTVHCAQCHNHKFDPITQEDYYRLQAVFAAIDRTDKSYDPDPAVAEKRARLEAKRSAAADRHAAAVADARKGAGPDLAAVERPLAAPTAPRPAEYGYHSAIADTPARQKWVQVDLGERVALDRVVLRPCFDEFNGIGAGFGFPVRFRVELSDDSAFKIGVTVLADETARDFPKPGTTRYTAAAGGKVGRYVRLTATRLAPRQNDYILAVAELEAIDAAGANRALGKPVSALDSVEAPVRWRASNLTDGRSPPEQLSAVERAKLTARRDELLSAAAGPELAAVTAELAAVKAELSTLPPPRTAYVGAVHTGTGTFVGTGAAGGRPRPIHVLPRGDVTRPGKEVAPGGIAAVPVAFALPASHAEGDRRAALARWVAHRDNPLTWRVLANRVWQYHFGRGIVDTPNDFGKMGQPPTHPGLLDHLAADLRDHQSLKRLHRLIVTSDTYRQTSADRPADAARDRENRYLWRQNRRQLEAEAVRDGILSVAGKLDLTAGGPSFRDFVVEKPEHSPHYQYHLADPDDPATHRRAVYRFVVRSKQQPFLAALDCADPSLAVDRRTPSQTPQQALALLNSPLAVAMSKHFAARVATLGATDAERVTAAVRLALGRDPTAAERDALAGYAAKHGLANACRLVLNLNEFAFVD